MPPAPFTLTCCSLDVFFYFAADSFCCLAGVPDLMPMAMAPMAEYKDVSVADVLPSFPAPCAPPGLPLPAHGSLCGELVVASLLLLARVSHARCDVLR